MNNYFYCLVQIFLLPPVKWKLLNHVRLFVWIIRLNEDAKGCSCIPPKVEIIWRWTTCHLDWRWAPSLWIDTDFASIHSANLLNTSMCYHTTYQLLKLYSKIRDKAHSFKLHMFFTLLIILIITHPFKFCLWLLHQSLPLLCLLFFLPFFFETVLFIQERKTQNN